MIEHKSRQNKKRKCLKIDNLLKKNHLCQKKVTLFVTRKEIEKKGLSLNDIVVVTQRTSQHSTTKQKTSPTKILFK